MASCMANSAEWAISAWVSVTSILLSLGVGGTGLGVGGTVCDPAPRGVAGTVRFPRGVLGSRTRTTCGGC